MSTTSDQPGEPGTFRVTGVVRFADGIPASRTRVAAFDRDLRSEQPLGAAETDRQPAQDPYVARLEEELKKQK